MRNRIVQICMVFGLLCLCGLQASAQGKKWALLIGVEEYESPDVSRLSFAVKDVKAVAKHLPGLGFPESNIRVMTSDIKAAGDINRPINTGVLKALDYFASEVGPEDTFLLYFTGHGFSKEGQTFLGSVNVDPASIETLQISGIPVTLLQSKMKKFKARQVIFVVDACRNDPENGKGDGDNTRTANFSKSLKVAARPDGAQIGGSALLFACREGERAFEDAQKQQSIFTAYFIEALEGRADSLTMADITTYVQKQVTLWARQRQKQQTPELIQVGAGNIVLADRMAMGRTASNRNNTPRQEPMLPVQDAGIVLFNGSDLSAWVDMQGNPAEWRVYNGIMEVAVEKKDISTREVFKDYQLHLEFNLANMPNMWGQKKSNSGVFLNGQFEIQILDSVNNPTFIAGSCGSICYFKEPSSNECRPPGQWQTYDITFRSPRLDQYGKVTAPPRITLIWNGVKVHDNVMVDRLADPNKTTNRVLGSGPIILQGHGAPVQFRNIWIKRL